MDLHGLKSPESENPILIGWSLSLSLCVYYNHNSSKKLQKFQIWYFTFLSYVDATVQTFYDDQANIRSTGAHKRTQMH